MAGKQDLQRSAIERFAQIEAERRALETESMLALLAICDAFQTVPDNPMPGAERLIEIGPDGCPPVAEFGLLELAARLGRTYESVAMQASQLLDLRHRFPKLFAAVLAGELAPWQAAQLTAECYQLNREQAGRVDAELGLIGYQSMARAKRRVRGLIAKLCPEVVEEQARDKRAGRFVAIGDSQAGSSDLFGRIGAADGRFLNATLNRLAEVFAAQGDESTLQQRRAKALGVLAVPARALQILQQAVQPQLVEPDEPTFDPDADEPATDPTCFGHLCGQVTVNPDRLLPRTTIHVHIAAESLETGDGVARVEGIGPILVGQLEDLLANTRITVLPTLDPAGLPPFDSYEIPDRLRTAVIDRNPTEVFPGSARPSRSCQIDHTEPYVFGPDRPPGQTSYGNLGPLGSRVHRAKTHAGWALRQPEPGVFEWRTPLGYHYRVTPERTEYLGNTNIHDPGPHADIVTRFAGLLFELAY